MDMHISDAELGRIQAQGGLTVGSTVSGTIEVIPSKDGDRLLFVWLWTVCVPVPLA